MWWSAAISYSYITEVILPDIPEEVAESLILLTPILLSIALCIALW